MATGNIESPSGRPQRVEVGGASLGRVTGSLEALQEAFGGSNIRTSFVFELIDIRRPQALRVHVLVLNPRSYSLSEPFQSTLTPVQDSSVVAEETGIVMREITLEGTFGKKTRDPRSFIGSQGKKSGDEHFKDLRELFRQYSRLKKDPEQAPYIRLVFHSLRDDDHFIVVPRSFETPRDAQSTRMHYSYRITLTAIAEADQTSLRLRSSFDLFQIVDDATKIVTEAFNTARGAFAEVTALLADARRKIGNIDAVLINASALIDAVGNAISAGQDLIDFSFDAARDVAEGVEIAADDLLDAFGPDSDFTQSLSDGQVWKALKDLAAALDQFTLFPNRFRASTVDTVGNIEQAYEGEKRLTNRDFAERAAGATVASRLKVFYGREQNAGIDLSGYTGLKLRRVTAGDSIDSIANDERVPPELLRLINDLRYPYIGEGGGPGVLAPGDSMLVPTTATGATTELQPKPGFLTPEGALYGVDLALDPDALPEFDIRVNATRDLVDAEVQSGIPNVVQGTRITIETEQGRTVFLPEIGLRRSVGTRGTITSVLAASLNLREAILTDPRIAGIRDSRVVLDGDVLTQEITPILKGASEDVQFILPLGTASGV